MKQWELLHACKLRSSDNRQIWLFPLAHYTVRMLSTALGNPILNITYMYFNEEQKVRPIVRIPWYVYRIPSVASHWQVHNINDNINVKMIQKGPVCVNIYLCLGTPGKGGKSGGCRILGKAIQTYQSKISWVSKREKTFAMKNIACLLDFYTKPF